MKTHSGSILISLGERLVNDEEPDCRKMLAHCLTSMLQKLPKEDRDPLFEIIILWFKDKNASIAHLKKYIWIFCYILLKEVGSVKTYFFFKLYWD